MKKCCFIIPYFGKLPNYFPLFLKSCEKNREYNWLIFTDDLENYRYPNNVTKIFMQFDKMIEIIEDKFQFKTNITSPHKLCDFKPAYGFLFEEYITEYEFWGFCDVDVIFGNLDDFLTDNLLEKYDKFFTLGHLTIFRNEKQNNRIFMNDIKGEYWYRDSFTKIDTTVFDETFGGQKNVNNIFKYYNKRVLEEDWSMNSLIAPANFVKTTYNAKTNSFVNEKYKKALYVWQDGKIIRYFIKNKKLMQEEFMYMHFQSRPMKMDKTCINCTSFKILGNSFTTLENENIDIESYKKEKKTILSLRYIKTNLNWKINGIIRRVKGLIK